MTVGEFKTNFSSALKKVLEGHEINISYGKRKEIVAKLIPKPVEKKPVRKLGILEGKSRIAFGENFKMSDEEFLGL